MSKFIPGSDGESRNTAQPRLSRLYKIARSLLSPKVMKSKRIFLILFLPALLGLISSVIATKQDSESKRKSIEADQVPNWSRQDMNFFLHGSMSTEVVPEAVLRAFIHNYPD